MKHLSFRYTFSEPSVTIQYPEKQMYLHLLIFKRNASRHSVTFLIHLKAPTEKNKFYGPRMNPYFLLFPFTFIILKSKAQSTLTIWCCML